MAIDKKWGRDTWSHEPTEIWEYHRSWMFMREMSMNLQRSLYGNPIGTCRMFLDASWLVSLAKILCYAISPKGSQWTCLGMPRGRPSPWPPRIIPGRDQFDEYLVVMRSPPRAALSVVLHTTCMEVGLFVILPFLIFKSLFNCKLVRIEYPSQSVIVWGILISDWWAIRISLTLVQ